MIETVLKVDWHLEAECYINTFYKLAIWFPENILIKSDKDIFAISIKVTNVEITISYLEDYILALEPYLSEPCYVKKFNDADESYWLGKPEDIPLAKVTKALDDLKSLYQSIMAEGNDGSMIFGFMMGITPKEIVLDYMKEKIL